MDFSQALGQIKAGTRMRRAGWVAWLALVPSNYWGLGIALPFASVFLNLNAATVAPLAADALLTTATPAPVAPAPPAAQLGTWIVVQTKDGTLMPWTANQSDLLATDWEVVT